MAKKKTRFVVDQNEGSAWNTVIQTIIDKETGVNYLFVKSGYGAGLTVLLDGEGKPIVSPLPLDENT